MNLEPTNEFPDIKKSLELFKKAEELIPCQTQTMAKGQTQYVYGVAPIYLKSGKGCYVKDVDNNIYLDYTMAVGPLSLGYCFEAVDLAIIKQLNDGITFSLMHPLEVEVAELIAKIIPNAESIRYSKVGADVTSAAIRLARAYTGKNTILCCGYHGWHDWYIAVTDRSNGIPQEIKNNTYTFNYNDFDSVLNSIDDDTAAIILEPVVFDEPKDNFLHKLREICTEKGIILIFDEMWTGFRIALGGAQEYFGIKADLSTYSKAICNGMPLSVLTGRKDIMSLLEKDVFFFTTFGGEALSLAAAKATIEFMQANKVSDHLNRIGKAIKDGLNEILQKLNIDYIKCSGFNFRSIITFNHQKINNLEIKSLLQQEMIRRRILWGGFHNISYSHTEKEVEYTLMAYNDALKVVDEAVKNNNVTDSLKGSPVQPVFRKVGNFNMKPKK